MPSGDPFRVQIDNPNIEGKNNQVIYLISERDDSKNKLTLTVQNVSGSSLTFEPTTKLSLAMKAVLYSDVIGIIQVACPGWRSAVKTLHGQAIGLDLTPESQVTLANNDTLTFIFTNIVFTAQEVKDGQSKMADFVLSSPVVPGWLVNLKMSVLPWAVTPQPLLYFEADFFSVPTSQEWNVKVDDTPLYLSSKGQDAVYSNSIANHNIRSRLSFRLTNQDMNNALTLTPSSVFSLSFLPGEGSGALANAENLVNNIMLKELSTGDFRIEQATDEGSPVWTLTPKKQITLPARGGSYEFLLDAVLSNANPPTNQSGPGITEMYILYTNVPRRQGAGNYDDGYLATTIEKVAPTAEVPRISVSPEQDVYDVGQPIGFTWTAFGVENLQLSYTGSDGTPKNQTVDWTGTLSLTPPVWVQQRRTVAYRWTAIGAQPAEHSVVVKSLAESLSLPGMAFALQGDQISSLVFWGWAATVSSVQVRFLDGTRASLSARISWCGSERNPLAASGTWTLTAQDGDAFEISLALNADRDTLSPLPETVELGGAIALKLRGTAGSFVGSTVLATGELASVTASYDITRPMGFVMQEYKGQAPVTIAGAGSHWLHTNNS